MDSIAGGGGIVTLPAYYVCGLPPHIALGTNKFVSSTGATVASVRYLKNKCFHLPSLLVAVVMALIGSALGAKLSLVLSERVLKGFLIIALPLLAIFILKNKNSGGGQPKDLSKKKVLLLSAAAGLVIGAYDGFFGPGAGTFFLIFFNVIIGFDVLTSCGNAKIVNWASNSAAFVMFLVSGSVNLSLGLPALIFSISGSYIGSGIAIKKGAGAVRPMMIFVLCLLLLKICWDFFS